jgi:Arc/MetJ family transcription regulator
MPATEPLPSAGIAQPNHRRTRVAGAVRCVERHRARSESRQQPPDAEREESAENARAFMTVERKRQVIKVYRWCMARTNIDIDEAACAVVMRRYHLESKRAAVNFALRSLASEPMDVDDARRMRGSGWEGDLDEMRASRVS